MPPSLHLRHLHLNKLTPLPHATRIQDFFVRQHLDHKTVQSTLNHSLPNGETPPVTPPPSPTLLTFTPPPTYATGRREINSLSAAQISSLRGIGPDAPPLPKNATAPAEFYETRRGGQTTYHGPGQLVAYLICDLKTHKLSPRCHVRLLENSVIEAVRNRYGLQGHTTDNPGVWIGDARDGVVRDDDRKLAAVGVWLRRHVSAFGVGINVATELGWFDRIVACGLPGRKATSVEAERERMGNGKRERKDNLLVLGEELARVLAKQLNGVEGVATKVAEVAEHDQMHTPKSYREGG